MADTEDLYRAWVNDGRPFQLARPLVHLRDRLRGYGYTVYDIGDYAHLTRTTPEDHTPYSATGWPLPSPYGWGFALDIMPPPSGRGLPSLAELGAQLYTDRQAGYAGAGWLKYMNWEPTGSGGPCYQDRWQPTHTRRDSSDRGHIHLSARTDYQTSDAAAGYDPVARARGGAVADLSYDPNRVPALPGKRSAKLMIAELWTWIHGGVGVYAPEASERGGLIARLDRIEDAVARLESRPPVEPTPVDQDAIDAAVRAAMLNPAILSAFAKAVADEDHARSAG